MGGNFNTHEFFHGASPAGVKFARWFFLLMVFVFPPLLLGAAWLIRSPGLPLAAFVVQYLGLLAERWYFFVEAKHPQNLYYQAVA